MSGWPEPVRQAAHRVLGELLLSNLPPHESTQVVGVVATSVLCTCAGPDPERRRLMVELWCQTLREMVAAMPVEAG
jgi:hypothetical protein